MRIWIGQGFGLALLMGVFLAASCSTTEPRGDAATRGEGAFRTITLPKFPIGKTGTHEFLVKGLKERAYPFQLRIHTRGGVYGVFPTSPFENSAYRLEILDSSSRRVLAVKTFRLNSWQYVREGQYAQYFWRPGQPNLPFRERYRVRVTVLTPSRREWDEGQIYLR